MTTANISLVAPQSRFKAPTAPQLAAARAAVGSVLGSIVAIGIIGLGLLVAPIAALLVFGPSLLALF